MAMVVDSPILFYDFMQNLLVTAVLCQGCGGWNGYCDYKSVQFKSECWGVKWKLIHICGRLYLLMFLLRVGSFTLM